MDQLDVLLKTRSGALEALTHCFLPKSGFCFILEQYNTNPLSDISAYILNNNKLQTAFLLSFIIYNLILIKVCTLNPTEALSELL